MKPIDFASLLCSRLCHDLLSPVGAMSNGLELLVDEHNPEMREQCMSLLQDSATASANKLKFFRLAFGSAGGFGESVASDEIRAAIEGMFIHNGRIELNWMVAADTLSKPATKLLLNLVLIAGDALVRGGVLVVGAESQADRIELAIRATGPRIILDPEIRATLEGKVLEEVVTPRSAPAWLARTLAASEQGNSLMISAPDADYLLFGADLPAVGGT